MKAREVEEILSAASKLNPAHMDVTDNIEFICAVNAFAERVKPLVIKYADRLPEETKFFLKL